MTRCFSSRRCIISTHYLKSEEVGVINRIQLSAEGYETAQALIVKRFDNLQRRLESYLMIDR